MKNRRFLKPLDFETLSVTAPVFRTPDFRSDKSILDKIARSYELAEDPSVEAIVNFLLNIIVNSVMNIDIKPLNKIFKDSKFIECFESFLRDILISSNGCGILDWIEKDGLFYPIISSINASNLRKLGSPNSNLTAIIFDQPRELPGLLFNALTGDATARERIKSYGDFTFLDRVVRQEDILSITDPVLASDAKKNIKKMFIVKPDRMITYSIYKSGRYGVPFIYKAFPYVEVKNAILTAEGCFYTAASLVIFQLKSGSEDESLSSKSARLKRYMAAMQQISRVGILTTEETTQINVVSGWELKREQAQTNLKQYESLIFSSILQTSPDPSIDEISASVNSFVGLFKPLIQDLANIIAAKNNLEPVEIYIPRVILSSKEASEVIRLRDRGDITRTTAARNLGFDPEKEVEIRKSEKEKGLDELLIPPFLPFQGKGRPIDGTDTD